MDRRQRKSRLFALTAGGFALVIVAWWAYPHFSSREMFRRSKPALDAYAAQVASDPAALGAPPHRLGYYKVLKVEPLPHGFLFQHDQGNPFDWLGLAYSTEPPPDVEEDAAGEEKQFFSHVEGDWYRLWRP